jgi:hypothetical protein
MKYKLLNAIAYEVCRLLIEDKPSRKDIYIISLILKHCLEDWVMWKTEMTMSAVDAQAEELKKEWREEENKAIVEKFQKLFPDAQVSTHDANTGAVLIEHPPDGSNAQSLLGGAMEIKSPWSK